MKEALKLAQIAYDLGEVPVGAIVVNRVNNEIIGRGYNLRETDKNPLAHAEVIAINEASHTLGGWRLINCDIYVTLEPCPMCCGAIINSRLENVIFGAYDKKFGSVKSMQEMFELPYNHKPKAIGGILEEECSAILSSFFRDLRRKK
ncbi:MAG: nucleoside deaminase [Clostridiales bacterium]|nr:nucleoside deaminase [Clostridiales bacterium]